MLFEVSKVVLSRMLHLVIPAKNEAKYIRETLRRLSQSLVDLTIPWQIIVADNGSTDGTADVVRQYQTTRVCPDKERFEEVSCLNCPKVGKGAAIRHATTVTTRDAGHRTSDDKLIFGFIDADLSADPDAIPGMVGRVLKDKADIVIASRLLITKTTNRSWLRTLSSRIFNFIANLFLELRVADAQCGLKIMNAKGLKVIQSCQEEGWFLDIEFLAKARQQGLRITEIPVSWLEFRYPGRAQKVKIIRDGIAAIRAILRIRKQQKSAVRSPLSEPML